MSAENPEHYKGLDLEPFEVYDRMGWTENACKANIIKYLFRAGRKGSVIEDLKKARVYLNKLIAYHETK